MNEENEEIINDYLSNEYEANEEEYSGINNYFEEIPFFLTYYLICLNKFIIKNKYNLKIDIIENLIVKKYLLLYLPELSNIEEHLLEKYTINDLELPTINTEWLTESSFQTLLSKTQECALLFDYSDEDFNNYPHLYSKIITNCIFIKCFLELSINENNNKTVIETITNARYYKHKDYKITTNIIDEIIFNNNFQRKLQ
ncbi:MAG: hypothetical protein E7163_01840 [Firmicutes bacterium]|nr:hypothetical protein [Bacillota bacterium]